MGFCNDCGAEIESGEYCESCQLIRDLGLDKENFTGEDDFLGNIDDLLPTGEEVGETFGLDESGIEEAFALDDLNIGEEAFSLDDSKMNESEEAFALEDSDINVGEENFALDESDIDASEEAFALDESDIDVPEEPIALDGLDIGEGEEALALDDSDVGIGEENLALDDLDIDASEEAFALDESDIDASEEPIALDDLESGTEEESFALDDSDIGAGEEAFALDDSNFEESEETFALDDSNIEDDGGMPDLLDFMDDLNIDQELLGEGKSDIGAEDDVFSIEDAISEPEIVNKSTDVGDILSDALGVLNDSKMDQLEEEYMSLIPEGDKKEETKEKKKGFFARWFANVPIPEDEIEPEPTEEELAAKKAEKEKQKAEKKAAKEQKKKEKAEAKDKAKKEKLAAKQEKEKAKKEAEIPEEPSRINKVGAGIVFALFGAIACVVILGTNSFTYAQSVSNAKDYFSKKRYTKAYMQLVGLDIKEKDQTTFDKISTVMFVNKQFDSYENYYSMEKYPEALDSLVKGLKRYNKYLEQAKELDVKQDLDYVKAEIVSALDASFGLSEDSVSYLLNMDDQEKYSQEIVKLAQEN